VALAVLLAIGLSPSGAKEPRALAQPRSAAVLPQAKKPAPAAGKVLGGTGIIRYGALYDQGSGYNRFAYVVVTRFDARRAASLPGTTLVYKSGTSVQDEWSQGVTYREALENDWLLKDASGAYVKNIQFDAYVGDIGNPAYQQRFLENTLEFLQNTKVDGIFLDDVLGDPAVMTGRVYPEKYPSGEAWESAMTSFVLRVGRALKARGYYVLANAAKWIADDSRSDTGEHVAEFWNRLAPGVSGLMSEFWHQDPNDHARVRVLGASWNEHWGGWQNLVRLAQSRGVDFFGLTYGSARDVRTMRYARASFLLDWDGRGGAFLFSKTDDADPYHVAWVRQLGKPLSSKVERAPGIWQRRYERGMVVVNATSQAASIAVFKRQFGVAGGDALFVRVPRT
jgi:hypothetical protein